MSPISLQISLSLLTHVIEQKLFLFYVRVTLTSTKLAQKLSARSVRSRDNLRESLWALTASLIPVLL